MVAERQAADVVKRDTPILAIMGNPPYRRLRAGEVARLVGVHMNQLWDDLKRPVRDAGLQRSLNAFPDLYIAFYRWALWRLFEADGATRRGVVAYITNRGFLTGPGFGGLRRMLRERFDVIRIIDLRGNNKGVQPANIDIDENVFNIEVGVCILVAFATGQKPEGVEAQVRYADVWAQHSFTRAQKLALATAAMNDPGLLPDVPVEGRGMDRLKPHGFTGTDWPGLDELMTLRSNGVVTYRDHFAYSTTRSAMESRIPRWLGLPHEQAKAEFHDSALNKSHRAQLVPFEPDAIERVAYRPLDVRFLYNKPQYVDRMRDDLQEAWGTENVSLIAKVDGTGAGPAVWCHGFKPDQHSFRGSYGGWIFPFRDHVAGGQGSYMRPNLATDISTAYGSLVTSQELFDVILALLSASSYTTRFAQDLEDEFPHVPFPADPEVFRDAARVGARLRSLQTFAAEPGAPFRLARVNGTPLTNSLNIPQPRRAFIVADGVGEVFLLPDRSLRIVGVTQRAWSFSVSGYPVLYRWLKAREGETLGGPSGAALIRGALDVVWRIEEIVHLCDEADNILERALDAPLTRADLAIPARNEVALTIIEDEGDAPN
jgi:predicted helicase